MGNSPCDPNKDNSAVKECISIGATLYGGLMDSVQNFSLSKIAGASSGVAKILINGIGFLKSASVGAAGGVAGQDNAANGVAASIIGAVITSSIVTAISAT